MATIDEIRGAMNRANMLTIAAAAGAIDDLDQDISSTPTEAEVQAISDKVDELLAALRAAGLIESS